MILVFIVEIIVKMGMFKHQIHFILSVYFQIHFILITGKPYRRSSCGNLYGVNAGTILIGLRKGMKRGATLV